MRQLIIVLSIFSTVTVVQAQNTKVQTAFNYYKYNRVEDAVPEIEDAIMHEQTMNKEKTWYYRGLIYEKICNDSSLDAKYPNACRLAMESFNKSLAIDSKSDHAQDIAVRNMNLFALEFTKGVNFYNGKDFSKSLGVFEYLLTIIPGDTLSILNAGLSAEKLKNYSKAEDYFSRLIKMQFKDARIYQQLAVIKKAEKDTSGALTVLKEARTIFPDDLGLIIEEANIYLVSNNTSGAIETLSSAILKDPRNPSLYAARGNNYDKLKEKEKAAADYKKAIELDSNFFDPYFNYGGMIFNEGADLINKANDLPPSKTKEYDAMKKQAEEKFRIAMPFLEKAYSIRPKDVELLNTLRQLYARLGENVKYEKIKSEIDNLK